MIGERPWLSSLETNTSLPDLERVIDCCADANIERYA